MIIQSRVFHATGMEKDHAWGQAVETPGAVGVIEVQTEYDRAKERGMTALTRVMNILSYDLSALTRVEKTLGEEITSFVLLAETEQGVSLTVFGSGAVYIRRGTTFSALRKMAGTVKGSVKPGDIFFLFTKTAIDFLEKDLSNILSSSLSGQELSDTFSQLLGTHEEAEGAAVVVYEVAQVKSEVTGDVTHQVKSDVHGVKKRFALPRVGIPVRGLGTMLPLVKKRPYIAISLLLGVGFLVSVYLGLQKQASNKEYAVMRDAYDAANALFEEGVSLLSVDREGSRQKLTDARQMLAPLTQKELPKGKEANNIRELLQKIEDNLAIASNIFKKDLELYYDVEFLRKERSISFMTIKDGVLYFLDAKNGMIGSVTVETKEGEILGGGDTYVGARGLASTDTKLVILSQNGVFTLTPGSDAAILAISPEAIEGSADTVGAFGENIYLVDRNAGDVWRYVREGSAYGDGEPYFQSHITASLENSTNILIDGSIWFGSSIGKIFRYSQGAENPFLIRDVDPPFGDNVCITKEEESEQVFIVDSSHNRVVVLSDEGSYLRQYVWEGQKAIADCGVSEEHKQVFLLIDGKVYGVGVE